MTIDEENMSDDIVPSSGLYELLNVLGSRTGIRMRLERGKRFPAAPRFQEWLLIRAEEAER